MGYQTRFSIASVAASGLVLIATAGLVGWLVFLATGVVWLSSLVGTAAGFLLLRRITRSEAGRRESNAQTLRRASERIQARNTAERHAELAAHGLKPLSKS